MATIVAVIIILTCIVGCCGLYYYAYKPYNEAQKPLPEHPEFDAPLDQIYGNDGDEAKSATGQNPMHPNQQAGQHDDIEMGPRYSKVSGSAHYGQLSYEDQIGPYDIKPHKDIQHNDDKDQESEEEEEENLPRDRETKEEKERREKETKNKKYKASSNSPYFDRKDEVNLRKDSKLHSSKTGSKLAPLSVWATRVAPKLDLKLANLSDQLIQTFLVALPCEGNFYFEVTLFNEQSANSFVQIGVADARTCIKHAETVDFIDQLGNTTCLGVGRTPGGYCLDAISTEASSHSDSDGQMIVGAGGLSASKIKTCKYGNGIRLKQKDTYTALGSALHNRYGKHDLHVRAMDILGLYVDQVERKIYVSHNGHFTGHYIDLSNQPLDTNIP